MHLLGLKVENQYVLEYVCLCLLAFWLPGLSNQFHFISLQLFFIAYYCPSSI